MRQFELKDDARKVQELYALLKRRGFVWPSFEIYGGVAGFFDLGPMGAALRGNIERAWEHKFVVEEGFMLVDCPSIAPEIVFKSSGHLEEFTDLLVRCTSCMSPFRADHLLEGKVEGADALTPEELGAALREDRTKCPNCGGDLTDPEEFNLMFSTHIGPGQDKTAYLRPETAQSIFMDFPLLYRFNRERIPFGVAMLGKGFRNEISPRQGLLRQREFHMAEGEFFFDPKEVDFPPFARFRDLQVTLVSNSAPDRQVVKTLGSAVCEGMICSEVLAHFMGVTHAFAASIGISEAWMRFRQHGKGEMAHYARDCWDLEVLTSQGWVEMVGIADRSAYDLEQHSKGSGEDLSALRRYRSPVTRDVTRLKVDMKRLGPLFKGRAKEVAEALSLLDPEGTVKELSEGRPIRIILGKEEFMVPSDAVSMVKVRETVPGERYIPHVVEPSFGIDRLMVAVLEHAYHEAASSPLKEGPDDEGGPYRVMMFRPGIAPVKCGVFPLMNKDGLLEAADRLDRAMRDAGLSSYLDSSGSIGRRYARMDEVGTPFCITLDLGSLKDRMATLRERDSGDQKRLPIRDLPSIVCDLVLGKRVFGAL